MTGAAVGSEQGSDDGGPVAGESLGDPQAAALPGQVMAIPPTTAFSRETNPVAPFMRGNQRKVFGNYWKTFAERSRATGGGIGGFFKSLVGRGMNRANVMAAARDRRADERRNAALGGPGRSAMRTQLANAGEASATGSLGYPQEPGVAYDAAGAISTRQAFGMARARFNRSNHSNANDSVSLMNVHAGYDLSTGTRSVPLDTDTGGGTDGKFSAIVRANEEWGASAAEEDLHPHQPKPRLQTPDGAVKRVRFKDGQNDTVGLPVNAPDDNTTKPRPTAVKFHPVPMRDATRRGLTKRQAREMAISDDDAVADEATLWPMRNQLQRMDPDRLEVTGMNAEMQAMALQRANPAPDSADDMRMRTSVHRAARR